MKKFLLLLVVVCLLAPAGAASAASKSSVSSFISSLFGKKEKPQPKFRPMSKGVYKIK